MNSLNRLTFARFYKITEYVNWKKLTVKYWLDYSKNQYGLENNTFKPWKFINIDYKLHLLDFKFSIFTNENGDFLQTSHYPPLHWRDHKNIDSIFRTDVLLIEKVIHNIVKYRSIKRLMVIKKTQSASFLTFILINTFFKILQEIQSAFENMSYCTSTLNWSIF